MENTNLNEIIFACRIYAINRFLDYSAHDYVIKYEKLFERYFDMKVLLGILDDDTVYESKRELIKKAYKLSSFELAESLDVQKSNKMLKPVFDRVSISDEIKQSDKYYPFKELGPYNAFPRQIEKCGKVSELVKEFEGAMNRVQDNPPKNLKYLHIVMDRILQKYTWCIAASDYSGEDISLYDYMKISEAIVQCMIYSEVEDKEYCLAMGNFSGIQKYIFSVSNTNEKGVAKRLRARSFYVDLLIRVMAHYLAEQFGLSRANILMQTGGKFLLLLPNCTDINDRLNHIRAEFETYLFSTFKGAVSVNLAWLNIGENEICRYSDCMYELNQLIKEQKYSALKTVLCDGHGWKEDAFVIYDSLDNMQVCKSCGSNLAFKGEYCEQCADDQKIGERLPRTNYIVYQRKDVADSASIHVFGDYYVKLAKELDDSEAEWIEALNQAELKEEQFSYPVVHRYMVNHLPKNQKGEILTFSEIAEMAKGRSKLAVLKADVDVLGYLFADGMRRNHNHYGTISRTNTMSRMLELFFCGYINKILSEKLCYKNIYSVFSGGDDLLLIGPWDVMPNLACDIRTRFAEFVNVNRDITLSAAISIFSPKEHIAYMVDYTEEQLERAKNEEIANVHKESRNSVCFMGEVLSWDDFAKQKANVNTLSLMIENEMISNGILYRMVKYSDMYKQYIINDKVEGLMFKPYLHYDKIRNHSKIKEVDQWFKGYVDDMLDDRYTSGEVNKNLFYGAMTVKWAMNNTRKETNYGKEQE